MNLIKLIKTRQAAHVWLLLLLSLFFSFTACKCKNSKAESIENIVEVPKDSIEFRQNISIVLKSYISELNNSKNDTSKFTGWQQVVKDVYEQQDYQPLWVSSEVLSPKGKEMLHFLGTAEFLGLNKELYDYEKLQKLADSSVKILPTVDFNLAKQLDAGLTRSFLQMALHIDHGMFGDTVCGINTNFNTEKEKYITLLQKALTDSIGNTLSTLEPANPMYRRYMSALRAFVSTNNISSEPIVIRPPKTDSVGAVNDARKALVYHHYLIDSLKMNDSMYLMALQKFQKDNNLNADGKIGTNTIKALQRDNSQKFQLLAINADRWRKEHIIDLPERYVWVNLPSLKVKIIEQDTLRLEKNIVIGKTVPRNQTPTLESAINQIVLWPTWTVPQSIIKNEMKSFKGYKVYRTGNSIQVVQPPGLKNALGCVKILFPNKYSVYMHDTPSKSLFNLDFRAASHGCVRCQDALEIAANLMMMDTFKTNFNYDTLKVWRDDTIATRIFKLQKSIPVYFRYFTVETDLKGNLRFFPDVYNKDKGLIDFIFNRKQAHVQIAAVKRKMDALLAYSDAK